MFECLYLFTLFMKSIEMSLKLVMFCFALTNSRYAGNDKQ